MSLLKLEVGKKIKKELGDCLKKYKYKFDVKADGFVRHFEGGFNKVGVSIVDYHPKFEISFFFFIRLDAVETIVQKFIYVLEGYRELTWTLNIGIDHFTGFKEYAVNTENKLHDLATEVCMVYSSKIELFLEKYSNILNLDEAMNEQHKQIGYMTSTADYIRPIVIAKLTGNNNFKNAAEWYYKKYVEDYHLDTEGLDKIKEAIGYLQNHCSV